MQSATRTTKNRLHACPAIYQDRRHATLAGPQSVTVPLMRPPRVISPPLACRFLLLFFHSTMRYISLAGSELPCGVLVSGNCAISYRRSHRRFLCTSQWTRLAAHCGACLTFLMALPAKRIFQLPKSSLHIYFAGQLRKLNNLPKWIFSHRNMKVNHICRIARRQFNDIWMSVLLELSAS